MSENENEPDWVVEKQEIVHETPVMKTIKKYCYSNQDPDQKHTFTVMQARNWCNVIAVTEDEKIVMVKQPRMGIGEKTLEFPGGIMDAEDEHIEAAVLRELQEETGYAPIEGSKFEVLGWSHPNPAVLNNQCYSALVGPVKRTEKQNLDPGEIIEVIEIPIDDLPRMIEDHTFTHALMINSLFFLLAHSHARVPQPEDDSTYARLIAALKEFALTKNKSAV